MPSARSSAIDPLGMESIFASAIAFVRSLNIGPFSYRRGVAPAVRLPVLGLALRLDDLEGHRRRSGSRAPLHFLLELLLRLLLGVLVLGIATTHRHSGSPPSPSENSRSL